jgi:hypothetical protein
MVALAPAITRLFFVSIVVSLVSCGGGGDSDDSPQQYDTQAMAGTWLLSAEFSYSVDDAGVSGRGVETMRTVVSIESEDSGRATVHNCYPGIADQQISVSNNRFDYRLFDAPLEFILESEGTDSPKIDFQSGAIVLPGPANLRVLGAEASIAALSGDVALSGTARLIKISDADITLAAATVTFDGESPIELPLSCFTELSQRNRPAGDVADQLLHRVMASGSEQDTVLEIELQVSSREEESGAVMAFSDLRRTVVMENTEAITESVFVVDATKLNLSLPMSAVGDTATLELQFDPATE